MLELRQTPAPVRVTLTAFLALIGTGYLVSLAHIVASHGNADGRPGLSLDDLRAAYAGLSVDRATLQAVPSRMLQMLEGSMRQYVEDDAEFAVLRDWLAAGGDETGLERASGGTTPARVLTLNCLRCHAAEGGEEIGRRSPFGPDLLTVDYAALRPFLATTAGHGDGAVRLGPSPIRHLILITHAHMLAIPVFTLLVGGLFWLTRCPPRLRGLVTPLPMLALVIDFGGWWLARVVPEFVYAIAAAGAVFGAAFGFQLVAVAVDLWRPARARNPA